MSPRRARRLPPDVARRPRGGGRRATTPGRPEAPFPAGPQRVETWPDGDWIVRDLPGDSADKAYRCPGCDQVLPPGVPHVVAWPAWAEGAQERRHWHRACWRRRLHRRPGRGR